MDITTLLPQFGNLGFTIGAFLVALLVIVAVHEYGHYIVARWSGIHAEVFSIGFGPVLWSRRDKHGTDWQIAALPLGGYVKFLGDANAASVGGDKGGRNTMLGAPLWARAATVAAGPVFNFIFSFLIFAGVFLTQGKVAEPLTIGDIAPMPSEWMQELHAGDEILAINGKPVGSAAAFFQAGGDIEPGKPVVYTVRRDGAQTDVAGPHPQPPLASGVSPRSAAYRAGIEPGDLIIAANDAPITTFGELKNVVEASQGRDIALTLWRNGETIPVMLAPKPMDVPLADGGFETRWLIGVTGGMLFTPLTESQNIGQAVADAVAQVWMVITQSISGMWHMITGAISTCNLSSPVGIAETSGAMASQGAMSFIYFIAFLSTAIGLLNLFPIPVLDGGHLVFYAWEAVTGHPPGEKALNFAMALGMSILLTLMAFALLNDLVLCP